MITRSLKDDLGYYVTKEEVLRDLEEEQRREN
jgi:cytochrome c oxidase subunit 1